MTRSKFMIAGALIALVLAALGASSAQAACGNDGLRAAQTSAALPSGTTYLPDCMALEMASVPRKFGQTAVEPTFSPDGGRLRYRSAAGVADTPRLQSLLDSYISTRSATGWTVAPTSPPTATQIVAGTKEKGGPYTFNAALDGWLVLGATKAQSQVGVGRVYRGGLDGSFAPLSSLLVPINNSGTERLNADMGENESTGTSQDLSTTVFYPKLPSTSYFPGDPVSPLNQLQLEPGGDLNNYVAFKDGLGQPSLQLLARDGADNVYGGRCGSHLGGGVGSGFSSGRLNQGAISANGSRIYFSTRPGQSEADEVAGKELECNPFGPEGGAGGYPLRIFKRQSGPGGSNPQITEIAPGTGVNQPGDDLYQGASADGAKVFFTTTRALSAADLDSGSSCSATIGSSDGCDLYLYDETRPPGERLTDVSVGGTGDPTPGSGAEVLRNVASISGDGTRVYFAAAGVLTTTPNPEGAVAQAGQPNLYLYQRDADFPAGRTVFIGTLAPGDEDGLWGGEKSFGSDAYSVPLLGPGPEDGDGHVLFFASEAKLTADDTDAGFADAFRYDSDAGTLERISKAAPGGSETPAADVTVGTEGAGPNANFAETGRWVSEDGLTAAFTTPEPLSPGDGDEQPQPYVWKASTGEVSWLPGGSEASSVSLNVSLDGKSVAFATTDALLPQDGDTASDVYVVRAEGGFPNPPPPPDCEGEGCRTPQAPPLAPVPSSNTFNGPGNVKPKPPVKCKKGFVKRGGKCVKKKNKKGAKNKKQANKSTGGKR